MPSTGLIFITGKSGSGKSTLLYLLLGCLKPSEGHCYFKGKDLSRMSEKAMSSYRNMEVGMIFQSFCLLDDLTALENVMLPGLIAGLKRKKCKKKAEALLEELGVSSLSNRKVRNISGGEKQRCAIARALINDPSVILADEPTGSLDRANSNKVMDILSSISKRKLVVVVTHDEKIVAKYGGSRIILKDGLIQETSFTEEGEVQEKQKEKRGYRFWRWLLAKKQFKKDKINNFLLFASSLVCFCSILLSSSFLIGQEGSFKEEISSSLSFFTAKAMHEEESEIGGSSLRLIRQTRPDYKELNAALNDLNFSAELDYSFFFPEIQEVELKGQKITSELVPVFDIKLRDQNRWLLINGELPMTSSISECLVNEAFLSCCESEVLGNKLSFSVDLTFSDKGATDSFHSDFSFLIKGVVKDFSFLNEPRIYYSHIGLRDFLSLYELEEISSSRGKKITVHDLVKEASGSSAFSSYCYRIFPLDIEAAFSLYEKSLHPDDIKISSSYYLAANSYSSLSEAIKECLLLFAVISLLATCFVVGLLSFSSYSFSRKRSGTLNVLGAKKKDLRFIFAFPPVVVSFFSCLLSLVISPFLINAANQFFGSHYGSYSSFSNMRIYPFSNGSFIEIGLVFAAIFIPFLCSTLTISASKPINVYKELKDL